MDGLILAASMALATGTRTVLARFGLVLGIVATVTANAVYGASHGPVGVVVNMWPAVAFLVSSELLVGMLRTRPATVAETVAETVVSTPVAGDTGWTVAAPVTSQDPPVTTLEAVNVTGGAPVDVPVIAAEPMPVGMVYPTPARHG